MEIDLVHPSERVWRALTDARLLTRWFMRTDLAPREGSHFTLEPGTLPGFLGPVSGELVELSPPRRLVMLWQGESLHTRVAWELTSTDDGCRLLIVQTGFFGAPAALRSRALRATYLQLFDEQLPRMLDQLAAQRAAGRAAPGRRWQPRDPRQQAATVAMRAAVPRQRRPNTPEAGWAAGRAAGPVAGAAPAASPDPAPVPRPAGPLTRPAEGTAGRRFLPPGWQVGPAIAPGWARAAAVGVAATAVAVVVLWAMVGTTGLDPGRGIAGLETVRDAPGVAVQPGVEPSAVARPGTPSPGQPQPAPANPGHMAPPAGSVGMSGQDPTLPIRATAPPRTSVAPDPSEPTTEQSPVLAPPELTATMTTAGLPLLGGRSVRVTVANPGPGDAYGWELVVLVGDQTVTNVTGASYERVGDRVTFTPWEPELPAGAWVEVGFEVQAPVIGLLGASDPTGCTIDGRPCG